jgi:hypothetical protein
MKAFGLTLIVLSFSLASCSAERDTASPSEKVWCGPVDMRVQAIATLRSVDDVPVMVPGSSSEPRTIESVIVDGTTVAAGDRIASFSSGRSSVDYALALIDRASTQIDRRSDRSSTSLEYAKINADSSAAIAELALTRSYATLNTQSLAKSIVLDARRDLEVLSDKAGLLGWHRRAAEYDEAKRESSFETKLHAVDSMVTSKEAALSSLVVSAPAAGVIKLEPTPMGDSPVSGSHVYAGSLLARVVSMAHFDLDIELDLADGPYVRVGDIFRGSPFGKPSEEVVAKVVRVADVPSTKTALDSTRVFRMSAEILGRPPANGVDGAAYDGYITIFHAADAKTVNRSSVSDTGGTRRIRIVDQFGSQPREIVIGRVGPARMVVVSGLKCGDKVYSDFQMERGAVR